jgi:DDE superfamily endonuclease
VASLLRVAGLSRERCFVNYHRVLNRAVWSSCAASRILLGLLLDAFAPSGPVVLGIDDTIERRRGKRIAAEGIYGDLVRSSHGHFVKASGLRYAAGPDTLGRAGLGAAVPDRARPLGAVLPRAGQAPQEADGLGKAACRAGPSLAARAGTGPGR